MEAIESFMKTRGVLDTLENIQDAVERASTIVTNVLSFARKSESKQTPQPMETLMDQTVHIASSDYDLKKQFDFRYIEIVRKFESELPPVPCDPSMIQQVFLNLLRNAAEAMHETGFEGNATNTDWPGINSTDAARGVTGTVGCGYRGGDFQSSSIRHFQTSSRTYAVKDADTLGYNQRYDASSGVFQGGRLGRTSP